MLCLDSTRYNSEWYEGGWKDLCTVVCACAKEKILQEPHLWNHGGMDPLENCFPRFQI